MKLALLGLLTLASTAQAKLQFMECKTEVKDNVRKEIKGNVDLQTGKAQTLAVFEYRKDKLGLNEYVYAPDVQTKKTADGRTQFWTEWMHDFELTLPPAGGDRRRRPHGLRNLGRLRAVVGDRPAARVAAVAAARLRRDRRGEPGAL